MSISYNLASVKCGQQRLVLHLWQPEEWPFYTLVGSWAEQRAALSLQRDAPAKGKGKARTKTPLRRLNWVCFIWQTDKTPTFSTAPKTQPFQPGYLPKQMVHILASVIRKSQLSTHRTFDFVIQLPGTPPRKSGQMYPEWVNFFYWAVNYKSIKC